jgi:hypothetical protein
MANNFHLSESELDLEVQKNGIKTIASHCRSNELKLNT